MSGMQTARLEAPLRARREKAQWQRDRKALREVMDTNRSGKDYVAERITPQIARLMAKGLIRVEERLKSGRRGAILRTEFVLLFPNWASEVPPIRPARIRRLLIP